MAIVKLCIVSGRVQGVFFRASAQQQARKLGIAGYAKNLADGRVEVLAVGDETQVSRLIQWLRQGPPTAEVVGVEVMELQLMDLVAVPVEFITA
jgi:acylphosphatase